MRASTVLYHPRCAFPKYLESLFYEVSDLIRTDSIPLVTPVAQRHPLLSVFNSGSNSIGLLEPHLKYHPVSG